MLPESNLEIRIPLTTKNPDGDCNATNGNHGSSNATDAGDNQMTTVMLQRQVTTRWQR